MNDTNDQSRRLFLGKVIGAAAAASLPAAGMSTAAAAEMDAEDKWLKGVTGKHRCFFDFPQHKRGAGLVHILNYISTYQNAYGADIADIGAVGTFYAVGPESSIPMGFDDAMWKKYKFGEYLKLDDPQTGKPAVRNLFYKTLDGDEVPRVGPLGPFPPASISSLHGDMGTTFLMCNNAMMALSMHLSGLGFGETEAIYAELKEHILAEVHLVPAMVIAIEQAQGVGIAYNKQ